MKESTGDSSLRGLHEKLLIGYVTVVDELWAKSNTGLTSDQVNISARWVDLICRMDGVYLTTAKVWQTVFITVERKEWGSELDEKGKTLGVVFEKWRRKDALEATLEWARWLLQNGKGKEASAVMVAGRRNCGEGERLEMEKRWMSVLEADM